MKKYEKPKMETIEMEPCSELLSASDNNGHSNHGHETACAHGAHAWFCDND